MISLLKMVSFQFKEQTLYGEKLAVTIKEAQIKRYAKIPDPSFWHCFILITTDITLPTRITKLIKPYEGQIYNLPHQLILDPYKFEKGPNGLLFPIKVLPYMGTCTCLLYTSPSPRDGLLSRMPSSA